MIPILVGTAGPALAQDSTVAAQCPLRVEARLTSTRLVCDSTGQVVTRLTWRSEDLPRVLSQPDSARQAAVVVRRVYNRSLWLRSIGAGLVVGAANMALRKDNAEYLTLAAPGLVSLSFGYRDARRARRVLDAAVAQHNTALPR